MTYAKNDLSITLCWSPAAWFWAVCDDEDNVIENGVAGDITAAALMACAAFDKAATQ